MTEDKHAMETNSSDSQLDFRKELSELYAKTPLTEEHLMCNFGLYMRSSVLVKLLVINDLYQRIVNIPGVIMEFGTWWGQNLVLFENLRAIYEPFNKTRKVIGFDTFAGYTSVSEADRPGDVIRQGSYSVSGEYEDYLKRLIEIHEGMNVLGHKRGVHELVKGDVITSVPRYFEEHPETIVALAYLDLALYKPTHACLEALKPHLVPGSVVLMDELTWDAAPGEAVAFKEVFRDVRYRIEKSVFTPERAIVVIE